MSKSKSGLPSAEMAGRSNLLGRRTVYKRCLLALVLVGVAASLGSAQNREARSEPSAPSVPSGMVARWNLHLSSTHDVVEELSGTKARITGAVYPVHSPVGDALQFDGYTGALHGQSLKALAHPSNATIVCWLQLDAYPWNELPILDQYTTGQGQHRNFFFGLDAEGHLLARVGGETKKISAMSTGVVPLRVWTLVTLTIDRDDGLSFTIGGQASPSHGIPELVGTPAEAAGDLLIGHVRGPLLPGPAAMIHPQFPIEYSLEGSLAGLAIYDRVLSSDDIHALLAQADKRFLAPTPWPKFPRGVGDKQTFGAF